MYWGYPHIKVSEGPDLSQGVCYFIEYRYSYDTTRELKEESSHSSRVSLVWLFNPWCTDAPRVYCCAEGGIVEGVRLSLDTLQRHALRGSLLLLQDVLLIEWGRQTSANQWLQFQQGSYSTEEWNESLMAGTTQAHTDWRRLVINEIGGFKTPLGGLYRGSNVELDRG